MQHYKPVRPIRPGSLTRALFTAALAVFSLAVMPAPDVFTDGRIGSSGVALAEERPNVTVTPAVIEYKRKVDVHISGSGFKPNQKLGVRVPMGEVVSDIAFLVKPEAVTNEHGAFSSVWTVNREIRRKLLLPTSYTLEVVDGEGNTLATAPLVFCDPKAEKKAAACALLGKKVEKKKEK